MSHHDERDPTDELLAKARSVLDRRRATMAALEERHTRLRAVREGDGQSEAQDEDAPASVDPVRELWRARTGERRQALADRLEPDPSPPPDDAA